MIQEMQTLWYYHISFEQGDQTPHFFLLLKDRKLNWKQAGSELCPAQEKLGLANILRSSFIFQKLVLSSVYLKIEFVFH